MVDLLLNIALGGAIVLATLLGLSTLAGLDFDLDFDAPDVDTGGVGWVKGILAFITAGSFGAAAALERSFSTPVVVIVGLAAGFTLSWLMSAMLRFLLSQQENTNYEMEDVLATVGKVYLRIPTDGSGIVRVNVRGADRELRARSFDQKELPTGTDIRVVAVEGEFALVVADD